jgi:hypothetical protein
MHILLEAFPDAVDNKRVNPGPFCIVWVTERVAKNVKVYEFTFLGKSYIYVIGQ